MKVIECTETVSIWNRENHTIKIKVAVNGKFFCCEFYDKDSSEPSNILRFAATSAVDVFRMKKHIQTVEDFLWRCGYDGYFFNSCA